MLGAAGVDVAAADAASALADAAGEAAGDVVAVAAAAIAGDVAAGGRLENRTSPATAVLASRPSRLVASSTDQGGGKRQSGMI